MPKLPGKRGRKRGRDVPAVPRRGGDRGQEVDFGRISGQSGGPHEIPAECRPKDATGSEDDMWIRTKTVERSLPEEPMGITQPAPEPTSFDPYGYAGYGG